MDDEQTAHITSDDHAIEDEIDSAARFNKGGQEKSRKNEKGPNEWLAEKFDQLHDLYEGQMGKNPHSIRQYRNGESSQFCVAQPTDIRCSLSCGCYET